MSIFELSTFLRKVDLSNVLILIWLDLILISPPSTPPSIKCLSVLSLLCLFEVSEEKERLKELSLITPFVNFSSLILLLSFWLSLLIFRLLILLISSFFLLNSILELYSKFSFSYLNNIKYFVEFP